MPILGLAILAGVDTMSFLIIILTKILLDYNLHHGLGGEYLWYLLHFSGQKSKLRLKPAISTSHYHADLTIAI